MGQPDKCWYLHRYSLFVTARDLSIVTNFTKYFIICSRWTPTSYKHERVQTHSKTKMEMA